MNANLIFRQAAAINDIKTMQLLYQTNKIDIHEGGANSGMTALHWAAQNGHPLTILKLLQFQMDINQTDWKGNTPLHYAIQSIIKKSKYDQFLSITLILLQNGANPLIMNENKETPFTLLNQLKEMPAITHHKNRILSFNLIVHLIKVYISGEAKTKKQHVKIESCGRVHFFRFIKKF
jgi:hypothetical protein